MHRLSSPALSCAARLERNAAGLSSRCSDGVELNRAGAVVHAVKRRRILAGHVVSRPQQQGQLHAAVAVSCAPIEQRVCGRQRHGSELAVGEGHLKPRGGSRKRQDETSLKLSER